MSASLSPVQTAVIHAQLARTHAAHQAVLTQLAEQLDEQAAGLLDRLLHESDNLVASAQCSGCAGKMGQLQAEMATRKQVLVDQCEAKRAQLLAMAARKADENLGKEWAIVQNVAALGSMGYPCLAEMITSHLEETSLKMASEDPWEVMSLASRLEPAERFFRETMARRLATTKANEPGRMRGLAPRQAEWR